MPYLRHRKRFSVRGDGITIYGGGGSDISAFGSDWGSYGVEQLENGSVTLWFETGFAENWNSDTLTCSGGVDSVTVTGCTDVTLGFGNTAGLDLPGAFDDAASEKIFEEKIKALSHKF